MFCRMDPPIEESVIRMSESCWFLGHEVICEAVSEETEDTLASWKHDGTAYRLRSICQKNGDAFVSSRDAEKSNNRRIHHAGTSAAVWNIAGVFVKVKAWRPDMQLESDTIQFVEQLRSVPTPTVIHSWVDVRCHRSFLILKASKGRTLDQAWETLLFSRRNQLAVEVAEICKALAASTSGRLETVDCKGVTEPFLTSRPNPSEPSWKPQFLGPFDGKQLCSYLSDCSIINATSPFIFYHADLGPGNILVHDNGELAAIIDWESAAYYPKFWLGTKPMVSAGFLLSAGEGDDRKAWAASLTEALKRQGFAPDNEKYKAWKEAIDKKSDSI